jgi:vacuolar-type H+-ATPase subunit I/STV1
LHPLNVTLLLLLFAGDFGHGLLMMMFAAYLLINEKALLKQKLDEIFDMLFGGRYCIVLMATFSIFTGLIYNEFFSMPMTLFGGTRARVSDCFALSAAVTMMVHTLHTTCSGALVARTVLLLVKWFMILLLLHTACSSSSLCPLLAVLHQRHS